MSEQKFQHNVRSSAIKRSRYFKRLAWVNIIMVLVLMMGFLQGGLPGMLEPVAAHNLQTRMVSMFMDDATQAMLDARMAAPGWTPPDPLLQAGDELGLIIKVVPRDGTTTGVGGHIDFYVPNGVEVVDVGYLVPDGLGGFLESAMKGQSPIAVGAGSIGAKTTSELIGLGTSYTNVLGVTEAPVSSTGLHRGTIAGLYGDTGIFFSTDPDTAYGSWQNFTGDSTANGCGSKAFNTTALGKTITNNSGDIVVPCNKWDAEQLFAWGAKGTTYTDAGLRGSLAIVDYPDQRGNAPWGFASGVPGPQSGYAWNFDWDAYKSAGGVATVPANVQAGMTTSSVGPWQRIQYAGDRVSADQAGSLSTVLGYASVDAGNLGVAVSALPETTSQTDSNSPKVIRWAVGQLTQFRPEYAWVKIKVNSVAEIVNPSGCPVFHADTFGGDAGGTDNGKDHLWRYYEPTEVTWNGCLAAQKTATREIVKVGDTYQYKLKIYNMQNFTLSNVVVRDTIPSGVTFLGAVPAQTSGPNPLLWNVGTLLPGQKWEALVTVKAASTGPIDNCMEITTSQLGTQNVCDSTTTGLYPYLVPTKTVTPTGVAPGGTVVYDILVKNTGTGPTASPVIIREFLPAGFSYDLTYSPVVYINGALVTPTVNSSNLSEPVFTIPVALQAMKDLTIQFRALVGPGVEPGEYCNTYSVTQNGVPITTGSEGCVNVAGGRIGDTIWRDWDGDGIQDPAEEGIPNMPVYLYADGGTTPIRSTTTNSNGMYYFNGLEPGTYVVKVNDGTTPSGYTQTYDPDASVDNMHTVSLALNQQYLTADFGYRPTGTAVIGDLVYEDVGNDGSHTPGVDTGIAAVTVDLYEDSNGDGILQPGTDQLVASTVTDSNGLYSFINLPSEYDFLVKVDKVDPDIKTYFDNKYEPNPAYQLSTPEITSSLDLSGSDLDNDFGFWRVMPGKIGDQVFIDADGDQVYDTGETPLADISVYLYRDGQLIATTTSGPDGIYMFENLGPGNYKVSVETADPDIPDGYSATISTFTKTLAVGESYLTADFPFMPLISKTVDKIYAVTGDTLNFGISVNYPGSDLLSDVLVIDPYPAGLNVPPSAIGQGGTYGAYTPKPGVVGSDAIAGNSGILNLSATKDTYLNSDQTARNYGACITDDVYDKRRSLIQFDLSTIPSGSVIDSALLSLVMSGGQNGTTDVSAFRLTQDWGEGTKCDAAAAAGESTWNTSGTSAWTGGAWVDSDGTANVTTSPYDTQAVTTTGTYTWDLTGMAQEWVDGAGNSGTILIQTGVSQDKNFHSRTGVTPPVLAVNYTEYDYTTNTIVPGANVLAVGDSVSVVMTLRSTRAYSNMVPGTLKIYGGSGSCSGPTPASANVPANTNISFSWNCTLNDVGEYTFSTNASNGSYTFVSATSSTVLVSVDGSSNVITWNLGSNDSGTTGVTASSKYIYAFQGDDKLAFWAYNTSTSTWNNPLNPADTPAGVTIKEGGALTNDGSRYIYALRGDNSRVFLRYDTSTDTWNDAGITDLPGTTDKPVHKGGSLIYLNGYVYALLGNDSKQFWRYDVAGNSWTRMTDTLGNVKNGAGLTTDGTYIYATQGAGKKGFWRYNITSNAWAALTPTPENVGDGGALVYASGAIYVLRGGSQPTFWRYNIQFNNWTSLTSAPGKIDDGGAITYDGTYLYAFKGNGTPFYRYNLATGAWSSLAGAPANVKWGGALTYLPTGNVSSTTASAAPTLSTGVTYVKLRMTITSSSVVNNIAANTPTYTATGGATATFSGATLISPDDDISGSGDPVIYEWIATVTPSSSIGEVTFTVSNSLGASAASNSVIISPILTFSGVVGATPPAVIRNTGLLRNVSPYTVPSNVTETATSGSIGDRVWSDNDGDGIQDAGELGLSGVKVYIDSNDNGVWDSGEPYDITNSAGLYRIHGLPAGDYTVRTDPATHPTGYLPTTPPSLDVTLTAGQQYNDADFGLQPAGTGQIGDYLWLDSDSDGVQDSDEEGIPGISLTLEKCFGTVCVPVATTTTDADGLYSFSGLIKGDYRVTVDGSDPITSPYGGSFALDAATDPTYDLDGTGTPHVALVSLATDASINKAVDFGYNWSGTIGDYVWWDADRDGIQDGGESPIANAAVLLYYDANHNGILDPAMGDYQVGFAMTNTNGLYHFYHLPPGDYLVDVYEDSITVDGVRNVVPTTTNVVVVPLDPGETELDADFGYYRGALVEGNVFHDDDRNTVFDDDENGLTPVDVYLCLASVTTCDASSAWMTTTTDANGHFSFLVPEGDYTLAYNTAQTTTYPEPTTPLSYTFHAYPGEDFHPSYDFGVDNAGSIGDRVWNDADGIGDQDLGEVGIAGVTVNLYASNGTTWLAVTTTDAGGYYLFEGLQSGTYVVKVDATTLPGVFTNTYDEDSGTSSPDNRTAVPIVGNQAHLTADFGYHNITSFPISGNVFHDLGTVGTQDGADVGLAGITVNLYDATGTVLLASTTTNSLGDYTFPGMPNGSYVIKVDSTTLPSTAYIQTFETDGSLDNAIPVTVNNAPVVDKDFGYHDYPGSISGFVCLGDGNGFCSANEPPLAGVTVILVSAGPDGLLGTPDDIQTPTTTAQDGSYSFTNLPPGSYFVNEVNPSGYLSLADRDGGNPDSILVQLGLDEDKTHQDFEDTYPTGSIGDRVWLDEDSNGLQDAGEPGLANVKVTTVWAGPDGIPGNTDDVTYTTWTDSEGEYGFSGLLPGSYTVSVNPATLATGLAANPTYDLDGISTVHTAQLTLASGEEFDLADFGYNYASTTNVHEDSGLGAIGDRIWIDGNGNGIQDPGEPGLGGAVVNLYTDPDNNGTYTNLVATTTSRPDGSYIFDELPANAYVVSVVQPSNYTPTGDPDQPGQACTTCDNQTTIPILLGPGDVYVNADFGYKPTPEFGATIGDRVWLDANADGVQDSGELGIPGVSVALIRDLNANGVWDPGEPIIATTATDATGLYTFSGVSVTDGDGTDDYLVWVNDTAQVLALLDPTYDKDGITTPNISVVSNLTPAGDNTQDFGYAPPGHTPEGGLIGDTIFLDRNGDGFTPGEGLEGVTVRLYASNGTTLLAVTTTNENGNYYFDTLAQTGTYLVVVDTTTLPGGGVGLTNTYDPDGGTGSQSIVTLTELAPINLDQDFGYAASSPHTLSGTVWVDSDGDGVMDSTETIGIPGVTIVLYDADGNIIATTVTDGNGNYSFPGLPDGTYTVDVTDEDNLLDGYWKSECPTASCGLDGYSQPDPYPVTIDGADNPTADFGYYRFPASLGDFIFFDQDHDGIQGMFEVGISGAQVTLALTYPGLPAPTLVTVFSDINGAYYFGNLMLDENYTGSGLTEPAYQLSVLIPGSYPVVSPADQGLDDEDSDGIKSGGSVVVAVAAPNAILTRGEDIILYDFGFYPEPTAVDKVEGPNGMAGLNTITISWSTSNEMNILGFNLYRALGPDLEPVLVYETLAENSGSALGTLYTYVDRDVLPGVTYTYWLEVLKVEGEPERLDPSSILSPFMIFLPLLGH